MGRGQIPDSQTVPDLKWRVIIRPAAEADLQEAWQWYESQRAGLGDELVREIDKAILTLTTNPEHRPFYYREFRRILTHRFPYKVFYRVEQARVVIFRILHAKREHRRHLHI
jgi:plasmid stabilization system protein ParE